MLIPIADLNRPELNVYARLTEAQIRAQNDQFIAETPQVIACALNAGYAPVSFLMDEDNATVTARALIERCPNVPVYVGKWRRFGRLPAMRLRAACSVRFGDRKRRIPNPCF